MDRQTDGRTELLYQYRPLHFDAESCFKNIMHLRNRGCVRTLRPLFVYATACRPKARLWVTTRANIPWLYRLQITVSQFLGINTYGSAIVAQSCNCECAAISRYIGIR